MIPSKDTRQDLHETEKLSEFPELPFLTKNFLQSSDEYFVDNC